MYVREITASDELNRNFLTRANAASSNSDMPVPMKETNLRVAVVNGQGERGKKADLENTCEYMDPDVLILTETKLDPSISPVKFLPFHYTVDIRNGCMQGQDDLRGSKSTLHEYTDSVTWTR